MKCPSCRTDNLPSAERCAKCGYAFGGPGDSIACLASIEQTLEAILAQLKKQEVQEKPFDSRTEVSTDAKYITGRIVNYLLGIFVLLPLVVGLLVLYLRVK
jgi:hypothetical protein